MPDGAKILQLPIIEFPEAEPVGKMIDYDHLRAYLADDGTLQWSYGSIKGRPDAAWQVTLRDKVGPDRRPARRSSGLGFDGHLDRHLRLRRQGGRGRADHRGGRRRAHGLARRPLHLLEPRGLQAPHGDDRRGAPPGRHRHLGRHASRGGPVTSEQQSEDHLTAGRRVRGAGRRGPRARRRRRRRRCRCPASKSRRAAKLVTAFGLVLGGAAVFFVVRRFVHDWPLVQPELDDANWGWIGRGRAVRRPGHDQHRLGLAPRHAHARRRAPVLPDDRLVLRRRARQVRPRRRVAGARAAASWPGEAASPGRGRSPASPCRSGCSTWRPCSRRRPSSRSR